MGLVLGSEIVNVHSVGLKGRPREEWEGPQLFSLGGNFTVGEVGLQEARAWAEAADPIP